jgi:hypothetical protein
MVTAHRRRRPNLALVIMTGRRRRLREEREAEAMMAPAAANGSIEKANFNECGHGIAAKLATVDY